MKKFKINEYLSLRLDKGKTKIYVDNEHFRNCKYLLLDIKNEDVREYENVNSIDEAIDFYSKKHEKNKHLLDPETEFWGHCSNLQAWAENNYDTRLLDARLAFPLLKELTDAGDSMARKVFREEIVRRIREGIPSVKHFIMKERYTDYLSEEELGFCSDITVEYQGTMIPVIENTLSLAQRGIEDLSKVKGIFELDSLEVLDAGYNKLTNLPERIGRFTSLRKLDLKRNNIKVLPESIGNLTSLEILNLTLNDLTSLPESFGDLISLKELYIRLNNLKSLPESLGTLNSLEILDYRENKLWSEPDCFEILRDQGVSIKKYPQFPQKSLKML